MNTKRTNEVYARLSAEFPKMKLEEKQYKGVNAVFATVKSIIIDSSELKDLTEITKGCYIELGRSGANFRMIIF